MAPLAVLDSCVLYPLPLRDTLLRVAESELYVPIWSTRILDEVIRNLVADGRATRQQALRMASAMNSAFDMAAAPDRAIAMLESSMTNHPKDRHVLAAAVASDAELIVTFDLGHFPASACSPYAVETTHPDRFLTTLFDRHPDAVRGAVERQLRALVNPPLLLDDLLARLGATVPEFAAAVARGPEGVSPPQRARRRSGRGGGTSGPCRRG